MPTPTYTMLQATQAVDLYNAWEEDTLSAQDASDLVNNPEPASAPQKRKRNLLLLAIAAIAAAVATALNPP